MRASAPASRSQRIWLPCGSGRICGWWLSARRRISGSGPNQKRPQDLIGRNCKNLCLPTHGGPYAREFERDSRKIRVRVEWQLTFNGASQMLNAALSGFGLAYVPEGLAQPTSLRGVLGGCLRIGARPMPTIVSITKAVANLRERLHYSWGAPIWGLAQRPSLTSVNSFPRSQSSRRPATDAAG